MKTEEAIRHYGSRRELAGALGITTQAVHDWGDEVPELRAYQLQVLTDGALHARADSAEKTPTGDSRAPESHS